LRAFFDVAKIFSPLQIERSDGSPGATTRLKVMKDVKDFAEEGPTALFRTLAEEKTRLIPRSDVDVSVSFLAFRVSQIVFHFGISILLQIGWKQGQI